MRPIRKLLILQAFLFTLVIGTVLIGRFGNAQSPLQAVGFGMCDTIPCFQGITAGVTKYGAATKLLSLYGDLTEESHRAVVEVGGGAGLITIGVEPEGSTVTYIEFFVESNPRFPPIGDWVRQYGRPCGVFYGGRFSGSDLVGLVYASNYVIFSQGSTALSPNSHIAKIALVDPSPIYGSQSLCTLPRFGYSRIIPWSGFASWEFYRIAGLFQVP
jgi:hypothetical protein